MIAACYAIGAASLWGTCTVIGRWTLGHLDPLPVAGLRFSLALPVLIVWAALGHHFGGLSGSMASTALVPLLLIVIFPDALGMALYYVGLERTSASLATLAELAYPATAMLLAFRSTANFTSMQWAGVALLLVSLYFIRRKRLVSVP